MNSGARNNSRQESRPSRRLRVISESGMMLAMLHMASAIVGVLSDVLNVGVLFPRSSDALCALELGVTK